jgi:calcineurin-like phosphoesterase family protein
MSTIFLVSDTHFGHHNMYKFTNEDGSLVRPWAANADEGDEIMIQNWNSVVGINDKVYHLGDVAIPKKGLDVLHRLNGRKVLIKGNHDIFKLEDYTKHFYDIRGMHKLDNFILSHVPLHPDHLARWVKGNIHGHLHSRKVMMKTYKEVEDSRYINVSVECINNTPISIEEINAR